ncbi:MAG TPA: tandem-95 repeat protein, partial [Candidatus Nitrosotenuis sp.]|nr:tandem-95 repeat protein [Candidatus Nitrosotenuis sp.]
DPGFFVAVSGATSQDPCESGFTSQAGASQCMPLPPAASDDTDNTNEDTSVTTNVLGNDTNLFDIPVSVIIESAPTNGIATVNGGNTITYTPSPNYSGQDSYQYRVTDASGDFAVATVKITVSPVNDAPTISAIAPTTAPELAPITFDASATDVDSPTLAYSLVGEPAGASITPSGAFTWTPTESQGPGTYNFQVKVTDSFFDVFADVSITVTEVNQATTANAGDDQTVNENTLVSLSGAASDADIPAQTLTYSWSQISGTPVVLSDTTIASPTFTTPPVGLSGDTLTFSLVVSDGQTSTTDTVSVTVNNVDTVPPEAYNQFDPVTKNVLVYGTDNSDGNLGPITPSSITKTKWHTKYDDEGGHGYDEDSDDEHDGEHDQNRGHTSKTNAELRTYTITDHSGNSMKLTEVVKQKGNKIKVKVLSIQYGNDPVISPKLATKHFEWSLDKNRTIKELEQKMTIGKAKTKQETSAKYDSKKNETKIESQNPKSKETLSGMVLLKMGTSQGSLVISH